MLTPTWLIYHPKRDCSLISTNLVVYHDTLSGNQCPYIWNQEFLHSFCHAAEIRTKARGQINFWVSGDEYPRFTKLFCDLVFVVGTIHQWTKANAIDKLDSVVDSELAFDHHYKWGNVTPGQSHYLKIKKRYTLKAESTKSFQPQDASRKLIDIMPFLSENGIGVTTLHQKISVNKSGEGSRSARPYRVQDEIGHKLYQYLDNVAPIKLRGPLLKDKYPFSRRKCF